MNWLDWVIIVIVSLSALNGLRYGLILSVAKLAGFLAGIFIAYIYYRPLADFLSEQWNMKAILLPAVQEFLDRWLPVSDIVPPGLPPVKLTSATGVIPGQLNSIAENLAASLSAGVLEVISFLLIMAFTATVINLIGALLSKACQALFLGPVNHLGGLLFGAVKGVIVIMLLITLMAPFQRVDTAPGSPLARGKAFQESQLLPYFNPLFNAINRPLPAPPSNEGRSSGSI